MVIVVQPVARFGNTSGDPCFLGVLNGNLGCECLRLDRAERLESAVLGGRNKSGVSAPVRLAVRFETCVEFAELGLHLSFVNLIYKMPFIKVK